jgi:hypothetical protein
MLSCDNIGPAPKPIDIQKSGFVLADFLRVARLDHEHVRWAALSGWSIRESFFGPCAVRDAALALIVSMPGQLEIIPPDKNEAILSLRVWCSAERPLPPGPRKLGDLVTIHERGEFTRSGKWVKSTNFPLACEQEIDLGRWYHGFLAGAQAANPIEM